MDISFEQIKKIVDDHYKAGKKVENKEVQIELKCKKCKCDEFKTEEELYDHDYYVHQKSKIKSSPEK